MTQDYPGGHTCGYGEVEFELSRRAALPIGFFLGGLCDISLGPRWLYQASIICMRINSELDWTGLIARDSCNHGHERSLLSSRSDVKPTSAAALLCIHAISLVIFFCYSRLVSLGSTMCARVRERAREGLWSSLQVDTRHIPTQTERQLSGDG